MGHEITSAVAVVSFWAFIAIASAFGITYDYRKKQLAIEAVKFAIEHGQPMDAAVLDRLLSPDKSSGNGAQRGLVVGGIIVLAFAVGLGVLAFFISLVDQRALFPMLGAACLLLCIGAGLVIAGRFLAGAKAQSSASGPTG